MTGELGLRLLLGLLAAYHLGIGVLSLLSHGWTARVAGGLYGISIDAGPQLRYMLKMLGLYAIAFGLLLAVAAREPGANRPVIAAAIVLLAGRALCRLALGATVGRTFGASERRNRTHAALLLCEALLLAWWFPPSR